MQLHLLDVDRDRVQVEAVWRALLAEGKYSYYLSWAWVENWLSTLGDGGARVKLGIVEDAHGPVMAFFVGKKRIVRHGIVPSRGIFLNTTGCQDVDKIFIEFNALLHRSGAALSMPQLLEILPGAWDELMFAGLDLEKFPGNALAHVPVEYRLEVTRDSSAYYVDLSGARAAGSYLDQLSPKTRSQVRRSQRLYTERGELRLMSAESVSDAEAAFDDMLELHRQVWTARGRRSNFDTDYVLSFHRRLIRQRFAHGEIQLLRMLAGGQVIGCLYNLIHDGHVYAYQSGFCFEPDNRLKPGLVSHCAAIEYNAQAGLNTYELLAGDGQYKRSLGTGARRLIWCRLQKSRPQFWLERQARYLKRRFRHMGARAAARAVVREGEG